MWYDWIFPPVLFVIFLAWIYRSKFFQLRGFRSFVPPFLFLLKTLAGLALFFIYKDFYQIREEADIFRYFDKSKIILEAAQANPENYFRLIFGINTSAPELQPFMDKLYFFREPFGSTNKFIIRLHGVIRLFSGGNYHIHSLIFAFIGFVGQIFLFKTLIKEIPDKKIWLLFTIFLIPSVLLWSSAPMKEALIIFGTGLFINKLHALQHNKNTIIKIFLIIIAWMIICRTRSYIALFLLPTGLIWYLVRSQKPVIQAASFLLFIAAGLTSTWILHQKDNQADPVRIISEKQSDFISISDPDSTTSSFHLKRVNNDFSRMIGLVPQALLNSFTRPWLNNIHNNLALMGLIENLLLFSIILLMLIRFSRPKKWSLIFFFLFFFLMIATINGLIVPNSGALIRYRACVMPLFMSIFLFISRRTDPDLPFLLKK